MCRALILAFLAGLLAASPGQGGGIPPRLEVVSSDEAGLLLEFELDELVTEAVFEGGEERQRVSIPGGAFVGSPGEPALPVYRRLLAVPEGASIEVEAAVLDEAELADCRLVATPRDAEDGADRARGASAGPGVFAHLGEPATFRDLHVVDLTLHPVRYDADRAVVTVARRMRVKIDFVEGAGQKAPAGPAPTIPPSFDRLYRDLVIGYSPPERAGSVAPGAYLVICSDDSEVVSLLQPLLEWRTRQGWPAQLVTLTETGSTNTAIKSYIQGVYDDPAVSLEYVVIVGDATGAYAVPTWYETISGFQGEGDLPYSQLAGNDVLPDVHLGRLSISDTFTLENVVAKILGYEQTPDLSDPSWFTRSCIVGDPEPSGMSCVDSGRWVALRLAEVGHTEADTIFAYPWVSQMRTALDRGDTIFGYRGIYGMSGWSNVRTYTLTNGWKLPFCVILTCETGSFASGTAPTEAFLRTWDTANSQPRGGIGAIGLATPGTHTRYNNCLYYGIFRGFTTERHHRMGVALTRGCLELYLNYNRTEPHSVQKWSHWANLMGDPAVDVWTTPPEPFGVQHPASLAVGANSLTAIVTEGTTPVEHARVCLWKGEETYVVGATDAVGQVELPIVTVTAGEMLLTVTRHDNVPYLATIPVVAESLYVGYAEAVIDDDSGGESSGNGDGFVNPGETIELPVLLENFGVQGAAGVEATLTSEDPYVTIVDSEESFGNVAPGATAWSGDDFGFTVDGGCPHGHKLALGLEIRAGSDTWHSRIELPVTSAELAATGSAVHDGANSLLDPGETAEWSVTLHNGGGAVATGTTGTLVSLSSLVTVGDAIGTFGTVGIEGDGDNAADRFAISAVPSTYEGYVAHFLLITSFSGGAHDTVHVSLPVGQRSEGDPIGPDVRGYVAYDDTDTAYPEAPVYDWIELDPAHGGDGELIPFHDERKYEDESLVVDLPFPFTYYGESFSQATISTNGWIAMGSTPITAFRNWTIPAAGGPNGMLAVFWDDLYQDNGSNVFQKYDEANHRWIVEWSRMVNDWHESLIETFEAILYDPSYHPTDGGDGIIVYQYATVDNYDPTNGYATVGIESPDQSDGLLYTYWNDYPVGAPVLETGRAIRFVPTIDGPTGTLTGEVVNASTGGVPVVSASIAVIEAGRTFVTGANGTYSGRLAPGTYTAVASFAGLVSDSSFAVTIAEGAVTTVDFELLDAAPPVITASVPRWTDDTVGPYPIPATIRDGSPVAETTVYYRTGGGGFTSLPMLPQGGTDYLAQMPGQPIGTAVKYYIYARDETGLESTEPAGAPESTYVFAIAPRTTIFEDSFETHQGWIIGSAGDAATEGIWVRAEPVGTVYDGYQIQPEFDHSTDPAEMCFVTGNGSTDPDSSDVDGGKTTLFSPVLDLSGCLTASVSYWVWFSNDRGEYPGEDPWIVKVSDGTGWVDLERTVESTGEQWVQRTFVLEDTIELTSLVQFRFIAKDQPYASLVEAALDDFHVTGVFDVYTGAEPELSTVAHGERLDPGWPNPFSDETRMRYAVVRPAPVKLGVYDVMGRLVKTLVDDEVEAGVHEARWDGHNAVGRSAASGVYFVRFRTPESVQVRRLLLLR